MNFRTTLQLPPAPKKITYYTPIVSIGSCFAQNIATRFAYYKFPITANPFGVLFHPIAIQKVIQRALAQQPYTPEDFFLHNELWHSFSLHSDISKPELQETISFANTQQNKLYQALKEAQFFFITFGTAWVYTHKATREMVANCHKVPQTHFSKHLLSVEEIQQSIYQIISSVKTLNPHIECICTISPVRHLKDGFLENQVSKSHLFAALYPVISKQTCHYFPSYELLLDELRDYRFYTDDMVHPSELAINYIWQQLTATYIDTDTQKTMKQIDNIQKSLAHRPFNPHTENHKAFQEQLQQKIAAIQAQYPHIQF